MGNEGILQPLLLHQAPHFFFGTELVKGVINYKYKIYGRMLLLEDFYHYLFLLLVFTASAIYAGIERGFGHKGGNILTTLLVTIVALGNLLHSLKQWHSLWVEARTIGLRHYMRDYMKLIELFSYILVVFAFPLSLTIRKLRNSSNDDETPGKMPGNRTNITATSQDDNEDSEVVLGMMAVVAVLLWLKLLYYMQAFESTG